jgi:putative ABC transport system permease protein
MTTLLTVLLGRLPIGWLQLTHNKTRMAAALAGVAFANVLVFVQLGILSALKDTIAISYRPVVADIIISAADTNTLDDGSNVPRRILFQALAVPGVAAAAPLYIGAIDWVKPDGNAAKIQIYGLAPEARDFFAHEVSPSFDLLKLQNTVLVDRSTRGISLADLGTISPSTPLRFEVNGLTMSGIDTFSMGAGFSTDGNMIASDQTFLRLFPKRIAGTPSHILVKASPQADVAQVAAAIEQRLNSAAIMVRPLRQAIAADAQYQTTQRPVGVIFGFGVFLGLLVGIVIVYQVLATDVADHIREYATFKAIGYTDRFFLSVIIEEAIVLAILGFVPGLVLAALIYAAMASATGLPVAMTSTRMLVVFVGTTVACVISGFFSTRRLAAADPAELF